MHERARSRSEFLFRGNGTVLAPHHMTRYIYPSPLFFPKSALLLQPPANAQKRSRPVGRASYGPNGTDFITITPSGRAPPTRAQFDAWIYEEKQNDEKSRNPLGRAMRRVSGYQGNTTLESGKFQLEEGAPLVYVIKRTTSVLLGGADKGQFGIDEDVHEIECSEWYHMRPETLDGEGHDSWWMRLHDLYQGKFDRAFWSARETMDRLDIPAPLTKWYPRPDVEKSAVEIDNKARKDELTNPCLCSRDWWVDSEYACQLKCGHYLCLECLTNLVDMAGRSRFQPNEKDPGTKYWRCPICREINGVKVDRADIIRADELPWWRWKIAMRRLEQMQVDWLAVLAAAAVDQWVLEPSEEVAMRSNAQEIKAVQKVTVHFNDAVDLIEKIPIYVAKLLPWGFSLDNPVNTVEGDVLKKTIVDELRRLAAKRQRWNTDDLIEHMKNIGVAAVQPAIVSRDKKNRLGNPILPPGYEQYRDFLCEWAARCCFLSPTSRTEILRFMADMEKYKRRAWWKDVREVFFTSGDA